jgi:adenylosuccinate synthase
VGATVVLGAQWGDEGKGRVTDFFSERADVVVRYAGGNNAGHTIVIGDESFALSLIPSGVMYPQVTPVIGAGCVVDPSVLLAEMDMLEARGVDTSRLRISPTAHLIMPYHRALDALLEDRRGDAKIGTTRKGIGPAYGDKIARTGLRMLDLADPTGFRERLSAAVEEKNLVLGAYGGEPFDAEVIADEYLAMAERITPLITDASLLIHTALGAGKEVLFEGAQGTLLDIDHGTYPFVTSSSPGVGGVSSGAGIGPKAIDEVVGVSKAYITRVGAGPFPTELFDEVGERLVDVGGEYGVVTGRRRRPGWLDLVALRYAARINSLTSIFLTKLDVLSGFDEVRVATSYELDGGITTELPAGNDAIERCVPQYESFPGWEEDLGGVRSWEELPANARTYIEFVEDAVGAPVRWISVGPERQQLIER